MSNRAYTIDDLAREYGRSRQWAADNWRRLVREKKLPPTLSDTGSPVWDPAHVYAYRDKALPPAARVIAAALRAAMDAAHATPADAIHQDQVSEGRRRLDARFGARP